MPDDAKRKYQSVTSVPALRPHIAVPPLQMILLGDGRDGGSESTDGDPGKAGLSGAPDTQAAKERVVRKIIDHLKKEN